MSRLALLLAATFVLGCGGSAPLEPKQSVEGMRRVIESLGPDQSGRFFSYDGSEIPW